VKNNFLVSTTADIRSWRIDAAKHTLHYWQATPSGLYFITHKMQHKNTLY